MWLSNADRRVGVAIPPCRNDNIFFPPVAHLTCLCTVDAFPLAQGPQVPIPDLPADPSSLVPIYLSSPLKGTVSPDITFYFRFCKIKSVLCKTA